MSSLTLRIARPVIDVCDHPEGPRTRQLLLGAQVESLETKGAWSYVRARQDGYSGWIQTAGLADSAPPTHWVSAAATHAYSLADFKSAERLSLSLGSQVTVTGESGRFCETVQGYIPSVHLTPLSSRPSDPVSVAQLLLGTPYLWGGNSRLGIDCSGLVQVACHICGIPCPADSGPQERQLGAPVPEGSSYQPGDLLFWKGHVAWVKDEETLLHANAHSMSVALEPIDAAIDRIVSQGDGPVTGQRRLQL